MPKYPFVIFIDSCVFIENKYNFSDSSIFGILKRFVDQGKIKVMTSCVCISEVRDHITDDVSKSIKNIHDALGNNAILRTSFTEMLENPALDGENAVNAALDKFEQYLKSTNFTILDNSGVYIDDILQDYFNKLPPFGTGKKKAEFPDAIALKRLIRELENYEEIFVFTTDGDWVQALESNDRFIIYKNPNELFSRINLADDATSGKSTILLSFFRNQLKREKYIFSIEDEISKLNVEIDGGNLDAKGEFYYNHVNVIRNVINGIKSISINSVNLMSHVTQFQLSLVCVMSLSAECNYIEEPTLMQDEDGNDFMNGLNIYMLEKHLYNINVVINATLNDKDEMIFEKIIVNEGNGIILNSKSEVSSNPMNYDDNYLDSGPEIIRECDCPYCMETLKIRISKHMSLFSVKEIEYWREEIYTIDKRMNCYACEGEYTLKGKIILGLKGILTESIEITK